MFGVKLVSTSASTRPGRTTSETTGIFNIKFDVTANRNQDFLAQAATGFLSGVAFQYRVTTQENGMHMVPASTATIKSNAKISAGSFQIPKGKTERFDLAIESNLNQAGTYYADLDAIGLLSGAGQHVYTSLLNADLRTKTIEVKAGDVAISGTIDSASLNATTLTPTITGTAKGNVPYVHLLIVQEGAGLVQTGSIPVINGKWSTTISPALVPQAKPYKVTLRGYPGGNQDTSATELASGELTVKIASPTKPTKPPVMPLEPLVQPRAQNSAKPPVEQPAQPPVVKPTKPPVMPLEPLVQPSVPVEKPPQPLVQPAVQPAAKPTNSDSGQRDYMQQASAITAIQGTFSSILGSLLKMIKN
jgi:hypothetical protein